MNKRFLNRLMNICLGFGLMLVFFGTAVLVVCGTILLALVAFVLGPRYQNASMPRDAIERFVYWKGVERRKRFELKMSVRPNYSRRTWPKILLNLLNRKRDLLCSVAVR